jgi:tRNA1Val (adenine37-N6)-methyltransferase
VENFESSDWGDRLFCYHASFQEFADEIDDKYDLIISNPPFFNTNNATPSTDRNMARYTQSLSYTELLKGTINLLSNNGSCAFIIPFSEEQQFIEIGGDFGLFVNRITRVKGHRKASFKRSLLQFSFFDKGNEITELEIEISRHEYTEAYKKLVGDFYLKM